MHVSSLVALSDSRRRRAILATGHLSVVVEVLTVVTLTMPSLPGKVSITKGKRPVVSEEDKMTMSPGCKFGCSVFHLGRHSSCYSVDHLCQ